MPDSQLFLIDANALCYRSYFAIKGLSTRNGQATNAVYGFLSTLRKILREYKPRYFAVCFDVGAKTHRQKKFAEYKIQRPPMPDDLVSQLPLIKEVISGYNLPIFEQEGFEADDMIAAIAEKATKENPDWEVVIVSDDKDMFQLVNQKVKIFSIRKNRILSYEDIKESLGIEPRSIADYMGLTGDKVDNIPGVHGIGEVSARSLINQYGTLENILDHVENLKPPRLRDLIKDQKEMAILSKELALLERDMPLRLDWVQLEVKSPDHKRLVKIFNDLEFKRFAAELAGETQTENAVPVERLRNPKEIESLVAGIVKAGQFVFLFISPTSTEELSFVEKSIVVFTGKKVSYEIPVDQLAQLKPIFDNPQIIKITYDIKEKLRMLQSLNCTLKGKVFDCLLAGYLLTSSSGASDIGTMTWQYLQRNLSPNDHAGTVAGILYDLYAPLSSELKEKNLLNLFNTIEIPLAYVLCHMESTGVKVDVELLSRLSSECTQKINGLMKKLFELAGEEFNINSPKQLSRILFEKLCLPVVKKTKTGFSTDEEVLSKLAAKHACPALILEYRQLSKLQSTYIDALPRLVNPETGRIHASFNQAGTETGRLSSNNPNLQNIPIRTELGRQIRKAFIPGEKENVIIAADYSQIELRILAHLSQDQALIEAFKDDQDIHRATAALIFDVPEKEVIAEMRNTAKRINFGIIYGMSAFGLAKDLELPATEAQLFIDKYFLRYPGVKAFHERTIHECEEKGFVVTLLNRRRYIPEIKSENMAIRQFAQRQAINTPVQGSAADLIKLAMIRIQEEVEKKKLASRMIITVHDELVFDVPTKEEKILVQLVRHHMENTLSLSVPIIATIKKGKNWLETKEI